MLTQIKLFHKTGHDLDIIQKDIETSMNTWLQETYHQILDIRFSTSASDDWSEVWCLVLYRPLDAIDK